MELPYHRALIIIATAISVGVLAFGVSTLTSGHKDAGAHHSAGAAAAELKSAVSGELTRVSRNTGSAIYELTEYMIDSNPQIQSIEYMIDLSPQVKGTEYMIDTQPD